MNYFAGLSSRLFSLISGSADGGACTQTSDQDHVTTAPPVHPAAWRGRLATGPPVSLSLLAPTPDRHRVAEPGRLGTRRARSSCLVGRDRAVGGRDDANQRLIAATTAIAMIALRVSITVTTGS